MTEVTYLWHLPREEVDSLDALFTDEFIAGDSYVPSVGDEVQIQLPTHKEALDYEDDPHTFEVVEVSTLLRPSSRRTSASVYVDAHVIVSVVYKHGP